MLIKEEDNTNKSPADYILELNLKFRGKKVRVVDTKSPHFKKEGIISRFRFRNGDWEDPVMDLWIDGKDVELEDQSQILIINNQIK